MKKRIGIVCLISILMLASFHVSMAAENTISLEASNTEVKLDEEFTVTIKQSYGENCESIEGNIEYDSAFELVKLDKEWNNLSGSDTKIEAIPDPGAPESVLVYTFKAKSSVENGKISFKNIKVSVIENQASKSYEVADQTVLLTVKGNEPDTEQKTLTSISIASKPNTTTYKEGDKFSPSGMELIATYSDGTTKAITNYTYSPNGELKTTDKEVVISYTENGVTRTITQPITVNAVPTQQPPTNADNNNNNNNNSNNNGNNNGNTNKADTNTNSTNVTNVANAANTTDTTTSNSALPKTGKQTIALSILATLIVVGFVFYKQYQKYRDI